jgi:flagellar hook assembly protein FlgD
MSTSPVNPNPLATPMVSSPTSAASGASSESAAQSSLDALGNPDTFLTLLVAQLQYQDPESPADGTTFVTQLATFAGVEQQAQMRSDLDSIDQIAEVYVAPSASPAAAGSTPGTNSPPAPSSSPTNSN